MGIIKSISTKCPNYGLEFLKNVIRCFENDEELQVTDILISDFGFRILN